MPKVIPKFMPIKPKTPLLPAAALRKVTSKSGRGVYASSDLLFKGAIFGRDSIEVAEDLIDLRPKLVRRIILTLSSLQGEEDNDKNEEEPGKIIHEYRTTVVDGKVIDDVSRNIFEELSARWGGTDTEMAYYGSIDSTPHFIRLVGKYAEIYGEEILDERLVLRSGHKLSVKIVLENAIDWLIAKLRESRSGLLEYQRRNPLGIENQVWKDSGEFYVHKDKTPVNHNAPIASIEVQGLTYDALMTAKKLFPRKYSDLDMLAHSVRDATIWLLWQPNRHYFSLGLDYDDAGELRVIETKTANPGALLDTEFFDDLPASHRQQYIGGVVRTLVSSDFLTDAGIRSRSLQADGLVPFWDYHGCFTSWPKETYDIAKGFRRQGFPLVARELENRLLNIVFKNWQYPEYVYVDKWGRVMTVSPSAQAHGDITLIDSTNAPERIQAWTVSAVMAITIGRLAAKLRSAKPLLREQWQIDLEQRLWSKMPRVKRMINPLSLKSRYPTYKYKLIKVRSENSSNFLHDKVQK